MDPSSIRRLGVALALLLIADLALGAYLVYRAQSRPVPRSEVERRLYAAREALRSGAGTERDWAAYVMAVADAGDVGEAEAAARRGLAAEGESPRILLALGRVLLKQGRREEAVEAFERVVDSVTRRRREILAKTGAESKAYSADLVDAALEAARVELDARSWARAVEWLDVALAENPTMADALALRAQAHAALGDAPAARRDAEAALRFVPGFLPALEVLRSLEAAR